MLCNPLVNILWFCTSYHFIWLYLQHWNISIVVKCNWQVTNDACVTFIAFHSTFKQLTMGCKTKILICIEKWLIINYTLATRPTCWQTKHHHIADCRLFSAPKRATKRHLWRGEGLFLFLFSRWTIFIPWLTLLTPQYSFSVLGVK